MAADRWAVAVRKAAALHDLPAHKREEAENDAFSELYTAFNSAKKDPALLDGNTAEAIAAVLELVVTVAARKRVLRKRGEDILKILLERPPWITAALGDAALLAKLREFASPAVGALLAPTLVKEEGEEEEDAKDDRGEGLEEPEPGAPKDKKDPQERMKMGLEVMKKFDFTFPHDPLGTKMDEATKGFQGLFDGVTWCYAGWGKQLLGAEGLGPYEPYWRGILTFVLTMYETPGRACYKGRIKFVVLKLAELSESFAEEMELYGRMPWDPVPDAPPKETPAALASCEPGPVRPGVVWIDFRREAYTTSALRSQDNICLAGFHDDDTADSYQPREEWLGYILDRVEDPYSRVAVVILNKKHQQAVVDIRGHCAKSSCEPPKFVVVTRKGAEGQFGDWGISDRCITTDWKQVPAIVNQEM